MIVIGILITKKGVNSASMVGGCNSKHGLIIAQVGWLCFSIIQYIETL